MGRLSYKEKLGGIRLSKCVFHQGKHEVDMDFPKIANGQHPTSEPHHVTCILLTSSVCPGKSWAVMKSTVVF